MIKWLRPSGTEIETNESESTIDYCLSLGWKPMRDNYAVEMKDVDASGTVFDPDVHWKNRRKDADGNWMVRK